MHALFPAAPIDGVPTSRAAQRQFRFPRARHQQAEAFPPHGVLLFGLRAHAQISNGFVVAGDAFSAEPYAVQLRKDIAPFKAMIVRDAGRQSTKGRSTGSSVLGSTVPFPACLPVQGAGT